MLKVGDWRIFYYPDNTYCYYHVIYIWDNALYCDAEVYYPFTKDFELFEGLDSAFVASLPPCPPQSEAFILLYKKLTVDTNFGLVRTSDGDYFD